MNAKAEGFLEEMEPGLEKAAAAIKNWTGADANKRTEILILLTGITGFDPATSWDGKSVEELVNADFNNLPFDLQIELGDCAQIDGDGFEL